MQTENCRFTHTARTRFTTIARTSSCWSHINNFGENFPKHWDQKKWNLRKQRTTGSHARHQALKPSQEWRGREAAGAKSTTSEEKFPKDCDQKKLYQRKQRTAGSHTTKQQTRKTEKRAYNNSNNNIEKLLELHVCNLGGEIPSQWDQKKWHQNANRRLSLHIHGSNQSNHHINSEDEKQLEPHRHQMKCNQCTQIMNCRFQLHKAIEPDSERNALHSNTTDNKLRSKT